MNQSRSVFTALVLTGALGLSVSPALSQSTPGGSLGSGVSKGRPQDQGSSSRQSESGVGNATGSSSQRSATQGQWDKDEIKKVQEALKEKGNDPGPIDGFMGPQTAKALREFQQSKGLKTTGRLDAQTAEALGVEIESTSSDRGSSSMGEKSSSRKSSESSSMDRKSNSQYNK